jgi:hypothetical protein
MTPLQMIKEWELGCTCAGPMYDRMTGNPEGTTRPSECQECTDGLIEAVKRYYTDEDGDK